ncbi:MAG: hypothetical protein ACI9IV_002157 [Paracoccaceae bacterium]|jgi:hypothetical protein
MLNISDTQLVVLTQDKRASLAERIDRWLLNEDNAWPAVDPQQRFQLLSDIMTYAEQGGMQSELDFAVFCRATILLRADWQGFVEAEPQRTLLLNKDFTVNSKLRAYYNRAERTARSRTGKGG